MNRFARMVLATLVVAAAFSPALARAGEDPCGIAGTGWFVGEAGLGGTGRAGDVGLGGSGRAGESGLGGTGAVPGDGDGSGIGGTGFVGNITGFGSICVNGARITYDRSTPVSVDGRGADVDALAIGQIVAAEAVFENGAWVASAIDVEHTVVGPIEAVDRAGAVLTVAGQTVRLASLDESALGGLTGGAWVAVCGVRDEDGTVVASSVAVTERDADSGAETGDVRVRGVLERGDDGRLTVGGASVAGASVADGTAEKFVGREVLVEGALVRGGLAAHAVSLSGGAAMTERVASVAVEGVVGRSSSGAALTVGGIELAGAERARLVGVSAAELEPGARVRVFGGVRTDGKIDVATVARSPRPPTRMHRGSRPELRGGGAPKPPPEVGEGSRPDHGSRPDRPPKADRPKRPPRPKRHHK